jgi:hypothetical protein
MKRSFAVECVRTMEKDDYMFYRYEIDGTVIWFSQYKDNGCIYTVSVALPKELDDFEIYVHDDSRNNIYYPQSFYVRTHKTLTAENMDKYIQNLEYIKGLCEAIMSIFTLGKHKELYDAHNS